MQKITPFLWFDGKAEEAAKFYVKTFPNSKLNKVMRTPEGGPGKKGSVLTVDFTIDGTKFVALNGGPGRNFTEAVSFVVTCRTQKEIDTYWKKLTANGGAPSMCGWLKDKYGVSWQIVPANIAKLISTPAGVQAMLGMQKLDIAALKAANRKTAKAPKAKSRARG